MKPVKKEGVMCKQMGEEMVLYDPGTESIHSLNPTAHFIWNLCDGHHSLEDIVEAVRINFSDTEDQDVLAQVEKVLDHFRSEKLLEIN